jgi:hypothetical protein
MLFYFVIFNKYVEDANNIDDIIKINNGALPPFLPNNKLNPLHNITRSA